METSKVCSTVNCGKPATLQCPTCIKLGLTPAFFCSDTCFKDFWPIHKLFHKKDSNSTLDSRFKGFAFTVHFANDLGPTKTRESLTQTIRSRIN